MESQYHQFDESNRSQHVEPKITSQRGMRKVVLSALYVILVVLLLILLMVTGIKFSQLNKEITDVKLQLERISHRIPSSPSSSASRAESERIAGVPLAKLVTVRGSCAEGWVYYQNSCYLLSTNTATWSKAEERCQAQGAHLVVVNRIEELDYLSGIVEISHNYWIGLVEREHEGHWSWVDGTDFNSTPTYWDEGQPDNWDYRANGEDCGQFHASAIRKRKLWNDADCDLPYRYICEKRA